MPRLFHSGRVDLPSTFWLDRCRNLLRVLTQSRNCLHGSVFTSLARSTRCSDSAPRRRANLRQIRQPQEFATPQRKSTSAAVCRFSASESAQQVNKHPVSPASGIPNCSSELSVSPEERTKPDVSNFFCFSHSMHPFRPRLKIARFKRMHAF